MKRFLSLLVACGAMSVFAATPVRYGDVRYTVENGKAVITGLASALTIDVIIPEKIGNFPVTKIAADAFEGSARLASVTIPASVTEIGTYAFNECTELKAVYISDLTAWCQIDFGNEYANPLHCAGNLYLNGAAVTSVTIPSTLKEVKDYTFVGCDTLTSAKISAGVTTIGEGAFSACGALASIEIPATVTTVEENAFFGCDSLVALTLPEGVKTVEDYAFFGCASLTDVTLPVSLTDVGDAVFSSVAPESLTASCLPSGMSSKNLTLVVIPEGVTALPDEAFAECDKLTTVKMPSTVKTIGDAAFYACSDLVQMSIPAAVTQIGEYAFTGVALPSVRIPAGVTTIAEGAFYYCQNLASVVIRNGVQEIGASAFEECNALTEVTLPASVTSVGRYALIACAKLDAVKFKGVPPVVGADAFTETKGYYANAVATAWSAVIANGTWQGLTMAAYAGTEAEPAETTTKIDVVKVIFDAAGGNGGMVVKKVCGTALAAPKVTREGYIFKGWSPAVPATAPAKDATYTAQWEKKYVEPTIYTITFDANGGTGSKIFNLAEGAQLVAPDVTREGYTFTGWSPAVPTKVPAQNAKYTAQWQIKQYTITFNANGGTGGKSVTQNYGTTLAAPTVKREGYTFVKWEPSVPATVPAEDATYTAQWKKATVDLAKLDVAVNLKKKQATIKGCTPAISGHLEIKSTILRDGESLTVIAIADNAFKGQTGLTQVTLPDSVTSIGKNAFSGCTNLDVNAIKMPNQPKLKVGKGAFTGCKVAEIAAVPGETKTGTIAAGYKVATSVSGFKLNAKTGVWTATFKKSGSYEAVLFKPGANLNVVRIKVGAMPKVTIEMEGENKGCSVKGASSYLMGKKVTVSAKASKEKIFEGFFDAQGKLVSSAMKYTFVMGREDMKLTAKFKEEVIDTGISALTSETWRVGQPYTVTLPVTAESGVKSVKAKLPSGLKLSKTKAGVWQVTGSPKKAGDYKVTVTVGTGQKKQKVDEFTMTVKPEETKLELSAVQNATLNVNHGVSNIVIGASATSAIKSVKASKLPSGMKVKCINGVWQLTGTPKKAGTYNVKFTMVTKAGTKVEQTVTLTVNLVPEWAAKSFTGDVINTWEEEDEWVEVSGLADVTVATTGEVKGSVSLTDGAFASLSGTAKLLESSPAKVRLQVTVPWFDPDGKADGKVKTELVIENLNGIVTLKYQDFVKGSSVTGTLYVLR